MWSIFLHVNIVNLIVIRNVTESYFGEAIITFLLQNIQFEIGYLSQLFKNWFCQNQQQQQHVYINYNETKNTLNLEYRNFQFSKIHNDLTIAFTYYI